MSGWQWFLVGYLALSSLIVFWRGASGSVRRYDAADAIVGIAECAFLIWIVVTRL